MRDLAWLISLEVFWVRHGGDNGESRSEWMERNVDVLVLHY